MKKQTMITKHIDKEGLEYIRSGSMKIGTLCGYRQIEKANMLTADLEEGWLTYIGNQPSGIAAYSIPSEGIYNCISVNNLGGHILIEESYDSWVFCASSGNYDKDRHKLIVHGNDDYKGNPTYTEYVVFDLLKLFDALTPAFGVTLRRNSIPGLIPKSVGHHSGPVKYLPVHRQRNVSELEASMSDIHITVDMFERAFEKPPNFIPEEEYRIIFGIDGYLPIFRGQLPAVIVPPTQAIADCILDYGTL